MLFTKLAATIAASSSLLLGASALVLTRQGELLLSNDAPVSTKATWDWTDCGLPTDPLQIKSLDVTPGLEPGKEMTVTLVGDVTSRIEEGAYADVTVKLGLIKILQKQFDLCEEARKANVAVQCPVEPGSYTIEQKFTLPKEIPPAKFTINVRGYTVEDDDLLCDDIKVDFLPKQPFF